MERPYIVLAISFPPHDTFNNSWFNVSQLRGWSSHNAVVYWRYFYELNSWR